MRGGRGKGRGRSKEVEGRGLLRSYDGRWGTCFRQGRAQTIFQGGVEGRICRRNVQICRRNI